MANWTTFTESNLATYQAGGYITAFKTAALNAGQGDPLPDAIASTVAKIRGAIKSGKYSVDRDAAKIPYELVNDACALVVGFCKVRITLQMSDDEVRNEADAKSLLNKIAAGNYSVSKPEDPEAASETIQSAGGASVVRPSHTAPKRSDYNGLI